MTKPPNLRIIVRPFLSGASCWLKTKTTPGQTISAEMVKPAWIAGTRQLLTIYFKISSFLSALAILTDATGLVFFDSFTTALISLGTDSHGPQQMRLMDFALAIAIKAGTQKDRILNFL